MDWGRVAVDNISDEALPIIPSLIQEEAEAMHSIAQNGAATNRVREALAEEKVRRKVEIPWGLVIETGLILTALATLIWSLFRS